MCVRVWFELAAVQLHPRRVRRKARIFSSVTHLGRWAWLGGREWGGREGEISVGPLLCTRGVKQRSQRGEETVRADLVRLVLRARSKTRRGTKEKLVASYRIRSLT